MQSLEHALKWIGRGIVASVMALLLFCVVLFAANDQRSNSPITPNTNRVLLIKVNGMIDLGLAPFIERAIHEAETKGHAVLILEINTFGGRLDAAVEIRDAILNTIVPTVAFINKRAISAGALISLATNHIFMTSGGTIGAATPVQMSPGQGMQPTSEKVVSYFRSEMKATAEKRKRPEKIAEAMVDPDVEIKGIIEKGKLLTLTSEDALTHKICDQILETREDVLAALQMPDATLDVISVNWGERFVRFITHPVVNSLLMTIAFLGLFLEFKTAGFGIAGILSILALVLFFFGNGAVHLVGLEDIIIMVLGVALLLAEVFLIPGFGITGIAGLICIFGGLVFALVNTNVPVTISDLTGAASQVSAAIVITIGLMVVLIRFLPSTTIGRRLVLSEQIKFPEGTPSSPRILYGKSGNIGEVGVAVTPLHPSGKGRFGDRVLNVIAQGEFIEKGTSIQILRIDGPSLIVSRWSS